MTLNKKQIKIGILIVGILSLFVLVWGITKIIQKIRVKNAKIEITLHDDMTINFLEEKRISDYIVSINGKIVDDKFIDTTSIGEKVIAFEFVNDDGIRVPYEYKLSVVDKVEPVIWLGNSYTVYKGNDIDTSKILCGDNEDASPHCYIEGEYDYNVPGEYPLVFKASDKSGNVAQRNFTLHVVEPKKNESAPVKDVLPSYTLFSDIYVKYKNDKTKIGIDVSGWQGDIDFEAIKQAGVEFMFIKVGGTKGTGKEFYVDSKFEQNIKKANEIGIDVGIYFYSYANSNKQAQEEAKWVIKQIKDYKVKLPVVFDWENWSSFNDYNLSFFGLTDMANSFLEVLNKSGYEGMIYSSKSYLEKLWLPTKYDIWLAHYTVNMEKTSYQGKYKYWQLCDDGKIDGINANVDIDIMYLD